MSLNECAVMKHNFQLVHSKNCGKLKYGNLCETLSSSMFLGKKFAMFHKNYCFSITSKCEQSKEKSKEYKFI